MYDIWGWQIDATLGDLAGGRYYNRDTVAAVTLGLATNAVYVESAKLIPNGSKSKYGETVVLLFFLHFVMLCWFHYKNTIVISKSICYFRLLICNGETSILHIFL